MCTDIEGQFKHRRIIYEDGDLVQELKRCLNRMLSFHARTISQYGIGEPEERVENPQFVDDE